jgi:protein-arginine kinase activator protein McsA
MKTSIERLVHFLCDYCKKWWSIGDATEDKKSWFCPWCGKENKIE